MRKPAINVIVAAVLLSLVGHGRQSELQKVIVSGKISYAGAPIENGQIYFYPTKKTKGPVSGAPIKERRINNCRGSDIASGEF
jgi:hypothetical protein